MDDVTKTAPESAATLSEPQKKGVIKTVLSALGFDIVEKGEVADNYAESTRTSNFWNAWYALQDVLCRYSWSKDRYEFESDEANIREALADFNTIVTDLLTEKNIAKSITPTEQIIKAGKKISGANKKKLDDACQILTELCADLTEAGDTEKEESDVTKDDVKKMIDEAIAKAAAPVEPAPAAEAPETAPAAEPVTTESVQKMIAEAVKKALDEQAKPAEADGEATEPLTAEAVQKMIAESLAPVLKARGLPSNLNSEPAQPVEKSEGAFAGFFVPAE